VSDIENSHRRSLAAAHAETEACFASWRRALGRHIANKRHLIDALVMGTQAVVAEIDQARAITAAVEKWKAEAAVARTLGVPEPSILDYLPAEQQA
jgi:hypothetical protein